MFGSFQFNDATRTALITWAQSLFPVLTILGVLVLTSEETAIIMVLISNTITLAAATFKTGQQADPKVLEAAVDARIRTMVATGVLVDPAAVH